MLKTLNFGRQHNFKQIILGHIGRKPEGSLAKVAARLGDLLDCDVPLLDDWYDEATGTIKDSVTAAIESAAPGSVLVLENSRKYAVERLLWKASADDLPKLAEPLSRLADQFAEKVATVYVNEAFSAGSLDATSTIVPAAMQRAVLGSYVAEELGDPMQECLKAELVVFSGLKADKLDDLEAIVQRGHVRWVLAGGSLAMALAKAVAQLDGGDFCLGIAEDPDHADKPYYIPPHRVEQAQRMIVQGREKGVRFVLPVDFILRDGTQAEVIGPEDQQLDVGERTSELFEQSIGTFLDEAAGRRAVAFHNGVLGMFEDPRFEQGTCRFMAQLKRMTDAGIAVYVGGGEGGKALARYGQSDWVTHCFTAGGTVLNALGNDPIPYLVALRMANR